MDLLCGEPLNLEQLREAYFNPVTVDLSEAALARVRAAHDVVQKAIQSNKTVYGVNTGFGRLANVSIPENELIELQKRLVISHAAGVGNDLSQGVVRLVLLIKAQCLAQGFSGVRQELIESILALINHNVIPAIPEKGSVGASGDLAPLSHMSLVLLHQGEVYYQNKKQPACEVLPKLDISPIELQAKEGLALLNGTQVSTALALSAVFEFERVFAANIVAGALTTEAALGHLSPFDARIQQVRRLNGQQQVAKWISTLLEDSDIRDPSKPAQRVQDPYSLRCQPQVLGACLDTFYHAKQQILSEVEAVTDNPLVFPEQGDIVSGGNFHAQPIAMAADTMALAISEVGALAERRIATLMDSNMSGLPHFLIEKGGLNSGFMMPHVTAAALASENKSLAHPASVDSLPTSGNQEDHVSMATFAARRLHDMINNTANIIGIELLAACQGVEFHKPRQSSPVLQEVIEKLREEVYFLEEDRNLQADMQFAKKWVGSDYFFELISEL